MAKCFGTRAILSAASRGGASGLPQRRDMDADGVHVVEQAVRVGGTMRCMVLYQRPESDDPMRLLTDIDVEEYNALPDAEEALRDLTAGEEPPIGQA